jgi:hypothetical protein
LVDHRQGAVQALVDLHSGPGVAQAVKTGEQLEGLSLKAHRVVPGDPTLILEAQHSLHTAVRVRLSIARSLLGRHHAKTGVEAGKEGAEELVRLLQRAGTGQTELCHQAILEGAPQPLDAPFGLRREGKDGGNAQLLQGPAKLGGLALPT